MTSTLAATDFAFFIYLTRKRKNPKEFQSRAPTERMTKQILLVRIRASEKSEKKLPNFLSPNNWIF